MPEVMAPPLSPREPGIPDQPQWYAAYTCARHEKQVRRQLEEREIRCFLPLYRSVRRWKDRQKELKLALFPGYVFVHIGPKDRLRVLQTPSVVRFVCVKGHPAVLADSEIESLQSGLANAVHLEPHPYLKVGCKARVKYGPLAGTEGILVRTNVRKKIGVRKKDRLRVVLSIDLIMRSVAVEVDAEDLE